MIKKSLILFLLFSFGLTNFSQALAQEKIQITAIQKEKITNKTKEKTQKDTIQRTLNSERETATPTKESKLSYKAERSKLYMLDFLICTFILLTGMFIAATADISST